MKKRFISCLSLASLMAIGLSVVLLNVSEDADKVEGYSTSSLPTTINLNDTTPANIRAYYSSLNNLSTSERSGNNLLKNLKTILKTGQKYLSYEDKSQIWDVYCIVDRDWEKSPASSMYGNYNPSTKMVTNYQWGGNTDKYENPYLHILYYNRVDDDGNKIDPVARAYGDHGNATHNPTGINREHIWPKGAGFDTSGAGGARGDIMHLWAAHGHTNNKHSNYYYGYVDKTKTYKDEATDTPECAGNLLGFSKTFGGTTNVFEPQDADKGDIARACFYMVARYNYLSGNDSDGINTNNPNLELVNNITSFSESGYTSSTSTTGKLGIIQDLLEWNRLDPPDEWEIHRNNLCYNNFTSNRNPFIDFPEWAEYIWGKSTDGSYSSSSTGVASPSSDVINDFSSGGGGGDPVSVTGVTLSPTQTSVTVGESVSLTATVIPNNATVKSVSWSSSDSEVASVSDGTVTGNKVGSATITVTTNDGDFTATCLVTVNKKETESTDVTVGISDYAEGYADIGTSGTIIKTVSSNNDLTINYSGINTKSKNGTVYSYTMYLSSKGYIYSSTCPSGYYPSQVVANFSSNTGTSGKAGISFGSSVISTRDSSVTGSVTTSGSCILSNNDTSKKYWNFSTTGANVQISSITVTYEPIPPVITSISAEVKNDKIFYVGQTISKADIKVTTNLGDDVTIDSAFNDYLFTYNDAPSGGSLASKTFENGVTYGSFTCDLTVQIQRKNRTNPNTITDVLTRDLIGVTSKSYTSWSGIEDQSDAVYAGKTVGTYSNTSVTVESIQMKSNDGNTGIISTSTGGRLKSIAVTFNSYTTSTKTLNIYGKNSAYSSPTDLFNEETQGTLLGTINKGNNAPLNVTGFYEYIGIRSASGAIYIDEINITYSEEDTASNVSNYIMFEDTVGQCNSKTTVATGYFEDLSASERNTFMTSDDYVISTARERLNAWLRNQGKSINYSGSDYVVSGANNIRIMFESNSTIIIVTIFSTIGGLSIFAYFYLRRKKRN